MVHGSDLKRGDIVRAPWRDAGDDIELTGTVVSKARGLVRIVWGEGGNCTQPGDESTFPEATMFEAVALFDKLP